MIMLTVTKPRRKLRRILKGAGLLLLLLAVVPGLYYTLSSVGAMSTFASGAAREGKGGAVDEAPSPGGSGDERQAAAQAGDEDTSTAEDKDEEKVNAEKNDAAADNEKAAAGDELKDDAAGAEDSAGAEKAPAEKAGLWQALQEVIFGREPEVRIYQNLG